MKPTEKKPSIIYRIISKETGGCVGSYSRAYCDEYDFSSVEGARNANCHNEFKKRYKYNIAKYKVIYELLDDDCDNSNNDVEPLNKLGMLYEFYPKMEA